MSQFYPAIFNKSKVFLVALSFLLLPAAMLFAQPVVTPYKTPGTFTFTVPAGITSITVEAWGGGGKGGTQTKTYQGVGGGGGGGGYSRSIINVVPLETYNIVVGAGSTTTAAGGDSYFNNSTILLAKGGNSVVNDIVFGAAGAAIGVGMVRYTGGNGSDGSIPSLYTGGGGSSAGTGANGNPATDHTGAPAVVGGGAGGDGRIASEGIGSAGGIPGGGGGGAGRLTAGARNGGKGGNGQVMITYAITITSFTPASACLGSTTPITITGTNFTGATAVKFNGVNASSYTVVSETSITAVLPATGVTTGPITVTTPNGTGTSSSSFAINTAPIITGQSTATQTRCVGVAANPLSVTASGGGLIYQWYSNGTPSNTGGTLLTGANSATFTPPTDVTAVGTTYYYVVVSGGTCTSAATSNVSGAITVNSLPTATISYSATAYCANSGNYSVIQTGQGGGTYSVSPAGLEVSSSGLINTTDASGGSYTISYLFTDGTCSNTTTTTIIIGAVANAGNSLADFCGGQPSAPLGGSYTGTATGASWTVSPAGAVGGTFTPNANDPNATWTPPTGFYGTATLTLTPTGGSCATNTAASKTVNVIQAPTGSFTATENSGMEPNDETICAGSTVTFTAPPGNNYYNFYRVGTSDTLQKGAVNVLNTSSLVNGDQVSVHVLNSLNCGTTFGPIVITVNPLPIPTLTASKTTICAGESITFTATGGGELYNFKVNGTSVLSGTSDTYFSDNYVWENGDVVTVEVTNADNCSAISAPVSVTVNALPTGTFTSSVSPTNEICAGENVTFTATGGTEYRFSVNSNFVEPTFSTTATFSSSTLTNPSIVSVEVKNDLGCIATYAPIVITVNPLPTGTIVVTEDSGTSNDFKICADAPVTYTFPTGYENYDFQVNNESQQSSPSNTYINTTLVAGDVVRVIVRSTGDCELTFTADEVTIVPAPSGTLTVSDNTICAEGNVTFTATSNANNTNYNFLINNVQASTGASNTFTTDIVEDGDVVTVEVTNSNGCNTTFNAITMTVTALPTGTMTIAETSGIANDDGTICAGADVIFTVPVGFSNYDFLLNGLSVQDGGSSTYTTNALAAGNKVTVTVTNVGGCIAVLNEFTMIVNPLPTVAAITGATEVCVEDNMTLANATTGGKWSSSDEAIAIVDENTGLVTGVSEGVVDILYTVWNTITNCSNTATKSITVIALPEVAAITGDLNVCIGSTTTLSNATTGGVWSSDALGIATIDGSNGNITGVANGTANISYTVTNVNGCVTVITVVMNVHALPVITPITGTLDVCINATTTLASTPTGGAWTSSNSLIATVGSNTGVVTGVSAGTVPITYSFTDGNLCSSTVTAVVTVNSLPVPTLDGPKVICLGSTDVYTTESGQFNYTWNILNGTVVGGGLTTETVTIHWGTVGVKSISVNYKDINGCSGQTFATVLNAPGSSPTLSGPPEVCLNSTKVYSSEPGKLNYDWSVSGGSIIAGGAVTDNTATILWSNAGNHSVSVNYSEGQFECSAASPTIYAVKVNPLPTATISLNNASVCENGTTPTITFKGSGSIAPYTFTYEINGGPEQTVVSSGNNATVSVPTGTPGTFTYTLLSVEDESATACAQPQSGSVEVTVTPTPSATVAYSESPVCMSSGPVSVTHTGTTGGTYTSSPGGLTINATTGEITPASSTARTYTVTYRVAAAGGCAAFTTTTSVTITTAPAATISYSDAPFCTTATPKDVTHIGSAGGTYSSTAGLTINAGTGQISPSSSTPGTHTVTYTIAASGGCAEFTTTTDVTVTVAPTATIEYSASPYCIGAGTANVTRTGTAGGTYTATPAGLIIDPTTGAINLATSTGGTYTVTYSVAASGGCGAISTQATVVINPAPTAVAGTSAVLTCANTGAVNITAGSDATNYSSVLWTSSGTGTFTDADNLTEASYTPGPADITAKSVTLTLTAYGNGGCGSVTSTKELTINPLPGAFIITPSSPNVKICSDGVQSLSVSVTAPGKHTYTSSSTSPYNNLAIPDNFPIDAGAVSVINVNLPPGAVITGGYVEFNIEHGYDADLIINLKGPNGKVLNLVHRGGADGADFKKTRLATVGSGTKIPKTKTDAPFSYLPKKIIYGSDGKIGVGPIGNVSTEPTWNTLIDVPNGDWVFSVQDVHGCHGTPNECDQGKGKEFAGTLENWTIFIEYDLAEDPIDVTWSTITDLYTSPGLGTAYTGEPLSTVYVNPQIAGARSYTATRTNEFGCSLSKIVPITVNQTPTVYISADYCTEPGKVLLAAISDPTASSYFWSTNQTTPVISVDLAGEYEVTAVTANGCMVSETISVANEIVTNGDFTLGDYGFTSPELAGKKYEYKENVPGTAELALGGSYGIGTNAQDYNANFWGHDHTTGSGKFMIVHGFPNANPQPTIWQQTVNVLPNTKYYFSAWAMSLNDIGPFAKLALSVDGTMLTDPTNNVLLPAGDNDNSNSGWKRIYGSMTTGPTTTTVVLSVLNTQTAPGNSRFGLDDISFSSLSTFVNLEPGSGSDAQVVCKNTPIKTIVYRVGNGDPGGPDVTGLPDGITSVFNGDKLTITGTPSIAGIHTYTITTTGTTTGCGATSVTGTITVEEQKIVFTSGSTASVCKDAAMPARVYTLSGTATGATVSGLPGGVTGVLSGDGKTFTISGTPTVGGTTTYTITTSGDCEAAIITGDITVQEQTLTLNSPVATKDQTVCINTPLLSNIQYTAGGTATSATFAGLPAGVTGVIYTGGVIIISGTPTEAGTFNYTVTSSGNCDAATATGTVTVTPAAAISLSSAAETDAQVACNNFPINLITYTVTNATGASITGGALPAGITGAFSGGVFTISGSTAQTGIFNYTITTSGGCASATVTGTITVNGHKIVLTTGASSPSVCAGATMTNIVYTISGEATGATISGQPDGIIGTLNGNTFTVSGIPNDVAKAYPYTITTSGPNCTPAILTGTITVRPAAIGGTIASQSVCSGGGGTLTVLGAVGTRTWQVSLDGGDTWNNTSPVNHTVAQGFTNLTSARLYRVEVLNNCGIVYSNVAMAGVHNLWTGAIDTDWQTAGNWSDNQLPDMSCPNVYIPNTLNQPVLDYNSSTIRNIYIDAGAILTVSGTGILQIAGTINNSGTFDVSEGEIDLNGTGAQNIGATTFENKAIKDLKISNNTGVNVNNDLDVYGSLEFGSPNARINTNGNLTLKSNIKNTAWVGQMTPAQVINGEVTVERFINTGTGVFQNGISHRKSWQLLAVPTDGNQSINSAWQEGATQPINVTTPNQLTGGNPNPGYGTMIVSNAGGAGGAIGLGFDQYTAPGPSIKVWNSTTGGYDGPPNTLNTPIYNIKGYMVMVRGDRSVFTSSAPAVPTTLRSKGTLFTPAKMPNSRSVAPGLFESVGNPYASAIDLRELTISGGLVKAFTVWDPRAAGSYGLGSFTYLHKDGDGNFYATPPTASYPGLNTPYNFIESGQAFLIQAEKTSGTVGFSENAKASGSSPQLLRGEGGAGRQSQLRTNLYVGSGTNMTLADGNLIQYDVSYSNELDGLDARKLTNTSENLGLRSNGKILAVERRAPIVETDTIFYYLSGVRVQPYKFEFIASHLTEFGVEGVMEDNYLGTKTPLSMEGTTEYSFTIENKPGSYASDRFRIVFKAAAGPLPVTFVSIKAAQQADDIAVDWKVENESNLKEYEVKKSFDGVRFVKTSIVPAGNNGIGAYTWLDKDVTPGWNYYRIKSIDENGKISISEVVKVLVEMIPPLITVYPNPIVNGVINVHLVNQPAGKYKLRLLNAQGQTMVAKQITREKGTSIEPLTWDYKLARGNYRIEITKPDGGVKVITVIY